MLLICNNYDAISKGIILKYLYFENGYNDLWFGKCRW